MHVQIINYRLKNLDKAAHAGLCTELAPQFAELPGLVSKIWLANHETGIYGGVYVWHDRQAMEDFTRTELFAAVLNHPNLTDITSTDYEVAEAPTAITRGMLEPA